MQTKTQVVEIEKGFTENRFKQQKHTKIHAKPKHPKNASTLTALSPHSLYCIDQGTSQSWVIVPGVGP